MKLGTVKNGERFAYVDEFKGTLLVSFRECFTTDDGSMRPGSKGTNRKYDLNDFPRNFCVLTFLCFYHRYLLERRSIQGPS